MKNEELAKAEPSLTEKGNEGRRTKDEGGLEAGEDEKLTSFVVFSVGSVGLSD